MISKLDYGSVLDEGAFLRGSNSLHAPHCGFFVQGVLISNQAPVSEIGITYRPASHPQVAAAYTSCHVQVLVWVSLEFVKTRSQQVRYGNSFYYYLRKGLVR